MKNPAQKWQASNKTKAKTLCKELQASNCVCKPQGALARGIGPPPEQLGKLLTSICLRLTFPKLYLATFKPRLNHNSYKPLYV